MAAMELSSRLKNASSANGADESGHDTTYTRDDRDLLRVGKQPVLKRNFGFMSVLGFSCTVLITWEGMLIVSTQSLLNGGPAGVIWGYIIVWIGTLSTFAVLSELASMYVRTDGYMIYLLILIGMGRAPTSGGQYHWVAILASDSSRQFLSYITGWMTLAGWQAVTASAAYLIGTLLQSIIILLKSDYAPQPWQTVLFLWAVIAFAVFINTVASKTLAHFEGLILVLHILGFFAVLIPLVYLSPHGDASFFTTFVNSGAWPNRGLSFLVGLPAAVFSLIGADSAVHVSSALSFFASILLMVTIFEMAEEIKNASTVVPQAIIISIVLNGLLGFGMTIAYLFCLGDLDAVLESQTTLGYPFLYVFQVGTGSTPGAAVLGLIIVILGVCSTVGALASSSRMLWSFARDRGVPFWEYFIRLNRRTSIPVYTIAFTTTISVLLSLIVLGSSVAFSNIVNLSIAGLYSSYLLCCALLLWRRLQQNGIKPYSSEVRETGPGKLHWGPWHLHGIFGILNNLFACIYLAFLWFWSFWPPVTPVMPATVNFNVLTFGATTLFAIVWYFIIGKKSYHGPVMEVEL